MEDNGSLRSRYVWNRGLFPRFQRCSSVTEQAPLPPRALNSEKNPRGTASLFSRRCTSVLLANFATEWNWVVYIILARYARKNLKARIFSPTATLVAEATPRPSGSLRLAVSLRSAVGHESRFAPASRLAFEKNLPSLPLRPLGCPSGRLCRSAPFSRHSVANLPNSTLEAVAAVTSL